MATSNNTPVGLETLIDPLGGCIGGDDNQADHDQAKCQRQQILAGRRVDAGRRHRYNALGANPIFEAIMGETGTKSNSALSNYREGAVSYDYYD